MRNRTPCRPPRLAPRRRGPSLAQVIGHDLRMRADAGSIVVWHHNAPVNSLSFEDPWLASASSDGMVLMTNTGAAAPTTRPGKRPGGCAAAGGGGAGRVFSPSTRRNLPIAGGEPVFAVDISDQYLAAGGRRDVVSIWAFTAAEAAAARAAAARTARGARKAGGGKRRGARGGGGDGSGGAGTLPGGGHAACPGGGGDGGGGAPAPGAPRSAPQPVARRGPAPRGGGIGGRGGAGSMEAATPMSFSPRPRAGGSGSGPSSAPGGARNGQQQPRYWVGSPRQGVGSGACRGGHAGGPTHMAVSPTPQISSRGPSGGRGGHSDAHSAPRAPPPAAPLVAPCPVAAAASHAGGGSSWGAARVASRMTPLGRLGDGPQQQQPQQRQR
jgi:hypothetical protein